MNQIRGRCVICTSVFTSNSISALQCGHTFHFVCINKWVERSKTCPICRVRTAERNIVKQLYFDSAEEIAASQADCNSAAQVETLSIALEQEKNDRLEAQEEVQKLKTAVATLEAKLEREKKYSREKIPLLQAQNRQLEMMLVDQQELERALERTKSQLRACEFYKAVTTAKDESAMDKYIKDDGGLEVGQFIKVLRRQLEESRKAQLKLKDDLKAERELIRSLKKKEYDLKNIVAALEKELRDVRCAADISTTPFNPKLKSLVLENSPRKRDSLGFNESVELNPDVLSSALRPRVRAVSPRTRPETRTALKPLFPNLSDDEDDDKSQEGDVSLRFPTRMDTVPSPRVPKTIRERVLKGSNGSHPTGLGGARNAAEKALANLELRSTSTNMLTRKPILKRKPDKSDVKNQRLSQFFHKRKPTDVIELDD
uniref:Zinc finger domain containing protein n=1 Tax=Haemonchus contortus TaxID=6289 RepID=W6NE64_HAECO